MNMYLDNLQNPIEFQGSVALAVVFLWRKVSLQSWNVAQAWPMGST